MLLLEKVHPSYDQKLDFLLKEYRNTGQGLVLLLSGPPGTGKTLTAEAGK